MNRGNMRIGKITAIAGAAAMAVTAFGATAASASTGPSSGAQAGGGSPPVNASHSGRTYVNQHGKGGGSYVKYQPVIFRLLNTRAASIFSTPTEWNSSSVAFGPMYGMRNNGYQTFVGNVVMQFSHRQCNAYFFGSGAGYCYYENVHITGIRPGQGGSVQNWHWSWRKNNWVNNR
jgi:hypothetical protein